MIIYYAINNSEKYLNYTKNSIKSLLKLGKPYRIYLFIFGDSSKLDLSFFHENKILIINKELKNNIFLTSLKWLAIYDLVDSKEEKFLFVDADTYFSKPPEILFEKYNAYDFVAREEIATEKDNYKFSIGGNAIAPSINHAVHKKIVEMFRSKPMPIFNTGVMLFNHNVLKKIAEKLVFYESIISSFSSKKIPYPSTNIHLIDEIASSIMFGKLDKFKYEILSKDLSPMYIEYKKREVQTQGVIMHIFSFYYDDFLKNAKLEL